MYLLSDAYAFGLLGDVSLREKMVELKRLGVVCAVITNPRRNE